MAYLRAEIDAEVLEFAVGAMQPDGDQVVGAPELDVGAPLARDTRLEHDEAVARRWVAPLQFQRLGQAQLGEGVPAPLLAIEGSFRDRRDGEALGLVQAIGQSETVDLGKPGADAYMRFGLVRVFSREEARSRRVPDRRLDLGVAQVALRAVGQVNHPCESVTIPHPRAFSHTPRAVRQRCYALLGAPGGAPASVTGTREWPAGSSLPMLIAPSGCATSSGDSASRCAFARPPGERAQGVGGIRSRRAVGYCWQYRANGVS